MSAPAFPIPGKLVISTLGARPVAFPEILSAKLVLYLFVRYVYKQCLISCFWFHDSMIYFCSIWSQNPALGRWRIVQLVEQFFFPVE